jgi:hypothetical protein
MAELIDHNSGKMFRVQAGESTLESSLSPEGIEEGIEEFPLINGIRVSHQPSKVLVKFLTPIPILIIQAASPQSPLQSLYNIVGIVDTEEILRKLCIWDVVKGNGPTVNEGSRVLAHYRCTVVETGFVLDKSAAADGDIVRFFSHHVSVYRSYFSR